MRILTPPSPSSPPRFKKEVTEKMNKKMKALVKTHASDKVVGIENVFVILVEAYSHHLQVGPGPVEVKAMKKEATKGGKELKKESTKGGKDLKKEATKGGKDLKKEPPKKGKSLKKEPAKKNTKGKK